MWGQGVRAKIGKDPGSPISKPWVAQNSKFLTRSIISRRINVGVPSVPVVFRSLSTITGTSVSLICASNASFCFARHAGLHLFSTWTSTTLRESAGKTVNLNIGDQRHSTASARPVGRCARGRLCWQQDNCPFRARRSRPARREPVMAHRKSHNPGGFDRISAKDRIPHCNPQITARLHPQFHPHSLSLTGVFEFNRVRSEGNACPLRRIRPPKV